MGTYRDSAPVTWPYKEEVMALPWARWVGWPPAQPWSISSDGPPESGSCRNLFMSRYIFLWGQWGGKGAGGVHERRWYNRRRQFCSRMWMESASILSPAPGFHWSRIPIYLSDALRVTPFWHGHRQRCECSILAMFLHRFHISQYPWCISLWTGSDISPWRVIVKGNLLK